MVNGTYSARGFQVVATNALDLVVGTQAASAGHIAATVSDVGSVLHADLTRVSRDVLASNESLRLANEAGFSAVQQSVNAGVSSVKTLGALNLAVQALGFAAVTHQLSKVGGQIGALRGDLAAQAQQLARYHELANAKLETLMDVAERSLQTQERILETLVNSRAVEAQQLIRQGWDNLRHKYREDAATRFEKSLDYDNTVYVSHALLADIYRERRDPSRAEGHYRRAVAFSEGKGTEIQGHAHVQFARFLDEEQRFADAAAQAAAAVRLIAKPQWRFYLAELLAASGSRPTSLSELEVSIVAEPALYGSAMLSERLAVLGPELAALLVRLDEERRAPIIGALERSERMLAALARLDDRSDGPLPALKFRQRALVDSAVRRPYDKLNDLSSEVEHHSGAVRAAGLDIGAHVMVRARSVRQRIEAQRAHMPSQDAPVVTVEHRVADALQRAFRALAMMLGLLLSLGLLGAFFPVGVAAMAGCIWWIHTANKKDKALLAARTASRVTEADRKARIAQWHEFEREQSMNLTEFDTELARSNELLRRAFGSDAPLLPEVADMAEREPRPERIPVPAWVTAQSGN